MHLELPALSPQIDRERYVKSIRYTDLGAGFCRGFS
jgi:hypothetical protein